MTDARYPKRFDAEDDATDASQGTANRAAVYRDVSVNPVHRGEAVVPALQVPPHPCSALRL